jgi:ABC-type multidrug transport system fused ATPase/permease subunit
MTFLKFAGPTVDKLFQDFQSTGSSPVDGPQRHEEALTLQNSICLKNISYRYPNSENDVIRDLTLNIPALTTVGLVGATGSGKTTTVDIILGLLRPSSGQILVDGQTITSLNMRSWQKCLGYVPQQIYLSDDTIAANIAFGIEKSDIDMAAVRRAAEIANLHEFVWNHLPNRYETLIGERGVRLSGGQRQRIGIARAMYHSPRVVILDEATSALDNVTEQAVMEAVTNLSSRVTLILIAHRLTTVKNCDQVFLLEQGRLAALGTYDQLITANDSFRNLARAGNDK